MVYAWGSICVQHWGPRKGVGAVGGHTLPQWGFAENFSGNFFLEMLYAKLCILGIFCDNWSTEWVHFALLNTDVEAFLINFLTRLDSFITLVER